MCIRDRFTGDIGVVGVPIPQDPGGPDELAKRGEVAADIAGGKAKPSWIVSHELPREQAPESYEHFDNCDQGWTKVVLHPDRTGA